MNTKKPLFTIMLASSMLGGLLSSCQISNPPIDVTEAWARPGFAGGNSAVYFIVQNPGREADTLLEASSPVAAIVELHISTMDSAGTMRMEQQEKVDIPPGVDVEFRPAGLHVMLINLLEDLQPGDTFEIVLSFENRGEITVPVEVHQP